MATCIVFDATDRIEEQVFSHLDSLATLSASPSGSHGSDDNTCAASQPTCWTTQKSMAHQATQGSERSKILSLSVDRAGFSLSIHGTETNV
ncbi:hypothetical protein PISMIDRAFT_675114 [Pisolithus microcarpus 441]|uniref:Uncharacterized protein n=1 Tax=Pisolithus microcarpus 441 TaxID=765257 RepID=A0A0C9YQ99_9AGAM|nr:hypothetical protein PISMIDRAFT_675114 [Pisolithus microcarpus 441]